MILSAIESVDQTGGAGIILRSDIGEIHSNAYTSEVWRNYTSDEYINYPHPGIIKQFTTLRNQWHVERGPCSAISEIIACPSYRQIMGMGKQAVPLILGQLQQEGDDPDYWFAALEAITGSDPVKESDYGNMVAMAQSWLNWANWENG